MILFCLSLALWNFWILSFISPKRFCEKRGRFVRSTTSNFSHKVKLTIFKGIETRKIQHFFFNGISFPVGIFFFSCPALIFFSFSVGVKVGDTLYNLKVHLMHKFPKEMWAFPANYFVTFTKTI